MHDSASRVQDSDKGRFQVHGTDSTRFKVHSSAGGVHGRDRRMLLLEVQDNNKSNFDVQCSKAGRQCQDEVRGVWQCQN